MPGLSHVPGRMGERGPLSKVLSQMLAVHTLQYKFLFKQRIALVPPFFPCPANTADTQISAQSLRSTQALCVICRH
jgi:hypothetical protein